MSEIKLLPCPFCGGEALECRTKIICSECTCTVYGRNMEIARKLWNARKPLERIFERLEERRSVHDCSRCRHYTKNGDECNEDCTDALVDDLIDIVKEEGGIDGVHHN